MAWNVMESEQSVNRQFVSHTGSKTASTQIVSTPKRVEQVLKDIGFSVGWLVVFLSTSQACVTQLTRSIVR